MEVIELSKEQVKYLYEVSMMKDFPDNERKPLSMILTAIDKGAYDCLGIVEKDTILGYAFFMKIGKDYLFDYYVILQEYRNSGIGSAFLQEIAKHYQDADSVIGEVEDFSLAESEEDKNLQERRYQFYLRNGYVDTAVRVKLFGVDYRVIEMAIGKAHTKEEIKELYRAHYKAIFPWIIYKQKVKIKNE